MLLRYTTKICLSIQYQAIGKFIFLENKREILAAPWYADKVPVTIGHWLESIRGPTLRAVTTTTLQCVPEALTSETGYRLLVAATWDHEYFENIRMSTRNK